MSDFQGYPVGSQPPDLNDAAPGSYQPPEANAMPVYYPQNLSEAPDAPRQKRERPDASFRISVPARIFLWIVGIIVGATLVFGSFLLWMFGLNYLGVLPESCVPAQQNGSSGQNEFNSDPFGDYKDYFDYFFGEGGIYGNPGGGNGGNGGNEGGNGGGSQSQGTPGLGVTVTPLELDFTIDNIYKTGLVIVTIADDSAFIGTEVAVNDLIVAVEGKPVAQVSDMSEIFAARGVGGKVDFTIARYENGVASTFNVTVTLVDIS